MEGKRYHEIEFELNFLTQGIVNPSFFGGTMATMVEVLQKRGGRKTFLWSSSNSFCS